LGWAGSALAALVIFVLSALVLETWERLRDWILTLAVAGQSLAQSRYLRTVWLTTMVLITAGFAALSASPAPDIVYRNF
jgi:chromate transport protein ChrA